MSVMRRLATLTLMCLAASSAFAADGVRVSVAAYLRQLGVNRSRVEIESKGEREATHQREAWGLERRVSVRLAIP